MYGIVFRDFLSVLFIGITIKFLDDIIDAEMDKTNGKINWFNYVGTGILPYIFILFSLAVIFNKNLTIPLFLSAYVVGMGKEYSSRYLLGIVGWTESLIIITIVVIFFGWQNGLTSLAVLLAIQLVDDLIDHSRDRETGEKNFVTLWGSGEVIIICGILIMAALFYSAYKLFLVMLAYLVITIFLDKTPWKEAI
ncbi:hypothetical protein [Candidatus Contubernalis alkaliaceticus]|uniref:hypothetical protein n=1 Tax=Candidatus Contubernalis alkaliaceticus TaxID=338645 RepID=UPI001F4C0308|nr:hypothetical protein [Candidatus Contubernalis alkalaceticus]UNC91900.1 hypothetical protein HUE98_07195 [Candidatus Contubernalis alkalaceticus]